MYELRGNGTYPNIATWEHIWSYNSILCHFIKKFLMKMAIALYLIAHPYDKCISLLEEK